MKYLIVFLSSILSLTATPERMTWDEEVFLGSNKDTYAIMRIHNDTLGSHFAYESETHLDEYSKQSGKRIKSTILYRREITVDASDADTFSEKRITLDKELKLAETLNKYNISFRQKVMPKWANRMQWNMRGITLDDSAHVTPISDQQLRDRYGLEQELLGDDEFLGKITAIAVIEDSIFLTLAIQGNNEGETEGLKSKVIYLPAIKAKRVLDWIDKDEIYLLAGSFDSEVEARKLARQLMLVSEQNKVYFPAVQLWSKRLTSDKLSYVVVLGDAQRRIMNNRVGKLNESLALQLVPISSKDFRDRFPVKK